MKPEIRSTSGENRCFYKCFVNKQRRFIETRKLDYSRTATLPQAFGTWKNFKHCNNLNTWEMCIRHDGDSGLRRGDVDEVFPVRYIITNAFLTRTVTLDNGNTTIAVKA